MRKISKDMIIADLVTIDPNIVVILMRLGLVQIARIFPIVIYPPIRYIPRVAGMELSPK